MAGRTDIRSLLQDFLGASPKEDVEKLRAAQGQRREQVGKERFSQQMGSVMDALGAGLTRSPVPRARELTAQPTATQDLDEQSRLMQQSTRSRLDAAGALDSVEQRAAKAQLDAQARVQASAAQEEMRQSMRTALKRDGLDDASIEAMVKNPKMYEAWARGQEAQKGRAHQSGEGARNRAAAMERAKVAASAAKERAANTGTGAAARNDQRMLERTVEGYAFTPNRLPSTESAKRMQGLTASSGRLKAINAELRGLIQKHGPKAVGPIAERMRQLREQQTVEGKNIAELGALSGPDMEIMKRVQGTDPTSVLGGMSARLGVSDPLGAVNELDSWVDRAVQSSASAYGYTPRGAGRPPAQAGSFSVEAGGGEGKVTVRDPKTGETFRINATDLDAALADKMERVQ